jgi:hypothetical protein
MKRAWIVPCAIGLSLLMLGVGFGQERTPTPHAPQGHVSTYKGLTVDLRQDATLESSESLPLKSCLAEHPPLFCVLLTIVITNSAKSTILLWTGTCDGPGITFDLRRSDGSWGNFPKKMGVVCLGNALGVQSLAPHESSVMYIRMADLFLELDTNEARAEVTGRGPFVIRANWTIWGCAVSGNLKKGASLEFPTAASMCAGGIPRQDFASLRSNKLEVRF